MPYGQGLVATKGPVSPQLPQTMLSQAEAAVATREIPGVGPGLLGVRVETTAGTGALEGATPQLGGGGRAGRTS